MIGFLMSAAVSVAVVAGAPGADPSLSPAAGAGVGARSGTVARAMSDGAQLLLDYDGVVMKLDSGGKMTLTLDGTEVGDLSSWASESGDIEFKGTLGGEAVGGRVLFKSAEKWTVQIDRPGHKPGVFTVKQDGGNVVVISAQICDCADGIGLTCKSGDCNGGVTCSAGTSTCKLKNAASTD